MADGSRAPGLREWLGVDPPAWPAVDGLDDGHAVVACYYLASIRELRTRSDTPYLKLTLCDRHGVVDGRVWEDAEKVAAALDEGEFVGVRGRVQIYRGDRQLKVDEITPVRVGPEERGLFLPRSSRDQERMEAELETWLASVADPGLRALLDRLLGGDTDVGRRFRHSPAAMRNHHAYVGGLLEHTLSVVGICDRLAEHYGWIVDRDLLVTGALLHDIGKIREIAPEAGFPYTDEGKLLGHILLGIEIVDRVARDIDALSDERRVLVLHLVASHQGRYEWQSPRQPHTLEGLLLHYADDVDAKMAQAIGRIDEVEDAGWSAYDRSFGRAFLRHAGNARAADRTARDVDGAADRGRGDTSGAAASAEAWRRTREVDP
ncbi:MAG: 3'-5' exoribonuclease YhaM family protein, partial [Gemmatimonadota bacterium]